MESEVTIYNKICELYNRLEKAKKDTNTAVYCELKENINMLEKQLFKLRKEGINNEKYKGR